jgi:hypothetical protein
MTRSQFCYVSSNLHVRCCSLQTIQSDPNRKLCHLVAISGFMYHPSYMKLIRVFVNTNSPISCIVTLVISSWFLFRVPKGILCDTPLEILFNHHIFQPSMLTSNSTNNAVLPVVYERLQCIFCNGHMPNNEVDLSINMDRVNTDIREFIQYSINQ